MRRLLLSLALLLTATPALSADYYVGPAGNDADCNGSDPRSLLQATAGAGIPPGCAQGNGVNFCNCAYRSPTPCNADLTAGQTCEFATGSYGALTAGTGNRIIPANSGTAGNPITYSCPSRNCKVRSIDGETLNASSRSYITVDGFTFDGGKAGACSVVPFGGTGGTKSVGNILSNGSSIDSVTGDNLLPLTTGCASGGGCGRIACVATTGGTGNTISNYTINIPSQSIAGASGGPSPNNLLVVGQGLTSSTRESGTLIENVTVAGWWNGVDLENCNDCVFDGLHVGLAKNHILTLHESSNLTMRNSVVMAGSDFREPAVTTRGAPTNTSTKINGLNLFNNVFISGWTIPSDSHECSISGTIRMYNNVFNMFEVSSSNRSVASLNFGSNVGAEICTNPSVTVDIDYNAYVGAQNFTCGAGGAGGMSWTDDRNVGTGRGPHYCATGTPPTFASGWKGLTSSGATIITALDQHSILVGSTDYRSNAGGGTEVTRGQLYGSSGPMWGAFVECTCNQAVAPAFCQTGEEDLDLDGTRDIEQYFWTQAAWSGGMAVGDMLESNYDGTARQILSKDTSGAVGNCVTRFKVTPPVTRDIRYHEWFTSYGQMDPDGTGAAPPLLAAGDVLTAANRAFVPVPTSVLIDKGSPDPLLCGKTIAGVACDIGIGETSTGAPVPAFLSLGAPVPTGVTEGDVIRVPVTLSQPQAGAIGVNYTLTDGSAFGGPPVLAPASETIIGVADDAHSITRGHNRKLIRDDVDGRWYLAWLGVTGGNIQSSLDGLTWSSPVSIGSGALAGFTAYDIVHSGDGNFYLLGNRIDLGGAGTADDVIEYGVWKITLLHDGAGGITVGTYQSSYTSPSPALSGPSHFYGSLLRQSTAIGGGSPAGTIWIAARVCDACSTTHTEVIRSTSADTLTAWGASGCTGARTGQSGNCNAAWTLPLSSVAFQAGTIANRLLDLGAAGIGLITYNKDNSPAPLPAAADAQLWFTLNKTGGHTQASWSTPFLLTNQINQNDDASGTGTNGLDTTRLDDRRYSAIVDPDTRVIHVVYVAADSTGSTNGDLRYFTLSPGAGSTYGTKGFEQTLIAGECDGAQLSGDTRGDKFIMRLSYLENTGSGYQLKLLTYNGTAWQPEASALPLSTVQGFRHYPGQVEAITSNDILVIDQENIPRVCVGGTNAGNTCQNDTQCPGGTCHPQNWNIVARAVNTCPTGVDYINSILTPTIGVGGTSAEIQIQTCSDAAAESVESGFIALTAPTCLSGTCDVVADLASRQFTIGGGVPVPTVTWASSTSTPAEGTSGTLVATLSGTWPLDITIPIAQPLTGTATGGGVDFTVTGTSILIAKNTLSGSLGFTFVDDAVIDANETIIVAMDTTAFDTTRVLPGAITSHTITIQDTDAGCTFSWTISKTQTESLGPMSFTMARTSGTGAASVQVSTVSGSGVNGAVSPFDFTAQTNTLVSFAAGEVTKIFWVDIIDDTLAEPDESFTAVMNTPITCTIANGTVTGTILASDQPVSPQQSIYGAWIYGATYTTEAGRVPRPLGISTHDTANIAQDLIDATVACSPLVTGSVCYSINISGCPGTTTALPALDVTIRYRPVQQSPLVTEVGLLMGLGGGSGGNFLDGSGTHTPLVPDIPATLTYNSGPNGLAAHGISSAMFKVGSGGWPNAEPGHPDGSRRGACRVATAIKWIDKHLRVGGTALGYIGSSGGTTALAYVCQQYGFCSRLAGLPHIDWAFLGSGPVAVKMDEGCSDSSLCVGACLTTNIGSVPPTSDYGFPPNGKNGMDSAFGDPTPDVCSPYNREWASEFALDEHQNPDQYWSMPKTRFILLRGINDSPAAGGCNNLKTDCTNAPNQQQRWWDLMTQHPENLIGPITTVSPCDHTYLEVKEGVAFAVSSATDPVIGLKVIP